MIWWRIRPGVAAIGLFLGLAAFPAYANWFTSLIKGLKGSDEAAAAAKTGGAAGMEHGAGATKAADAAIGAQSGVPPYLAQVGSRLAICVSKLQPARTKEDATHVCQSRYSACVAKKGKTQLTHPVEDCISEVNR